ncbi:hypothetical protein [Massilia sp. CFBP9026]|nr:hypothetical protein [Massilia sp. CFBP9026]MDY0963385.1 hypothetical protein [Massilia sp. CFBP9026]
MSGTLSSSAPRLLRLLALAAMLAGVATHVAAAPAALAEVRIQNLGGEQSAIPFTFGQVFAPGDLRKNEGLAARLDDGALLPLQADVKATHADGSVRHAVLSGVLPRLGARGNAAVALVKGEAPAPRAGGSQAIDSLLADGLDAGVTIEIGGATYRATLANAVAGARGGKGAGLWLDGPLVREWRGAAPLKAQGGAAHPLLEARFAVRWYPGLDRQARVEVVVENTKTFQAGARNLDYDVEVEVGGRTVYAKKGLRHYHHARWRQLAWWNAARAPDLHVRPDSAYLIASRAVSNYDQGIAPSELSLVNQVKRLPEEKTGPMTIGPVNPYMPATGGRNDIGPLPAWSVQYLLSKDPRALRTMVAAAEGSGSWSIHLRDERTGYPLRTDSAANRAVSTHMNLADKGPLPVPRCAAKGLCETPYKHDTSHQPSLAYLPYLLTGDYYYLEELQFWAASNPLETDPVNSGHGQGLVRWQQVRGQAWSLRTLGHAAYITPDAHPLKDYFARQLDNNLKFYHATYVAGNPNALGVYDGSGAGSFKVKASAPWQDDFLTWSFGYLAELGFEKALPILRWKAKYAVGRMTTPGFCWIQASAYHLEFRPGPKEPLFRDLPTMYAFNFGGDSILNESKKLRHPQGLKYIDQPCGSHEQSEWLRVASKGHWSPGRMSGFSDSVLGFPANMQPALALAATWGVPDADQAWERFEARADRPDYRKTPVWAIVPRAGLAREGAARR